MHWALSDAALGSSKPQHHEWITSPVPRSPQEGKSHGRCGDGEEAETLGAFSGLLSGRRLLVALKPLRPRLGAFEPRLPTRSYAHFARYFLRGHAQPVTQCSRRAAVARSVQRGGGPGGAGWAITPSHTRSSAITSRPHRTHPRAMLDPRRHLHCSVQIPRVPGHPWPALGRLSPCHFFSVASVQDGCAAPAKGRTTNQREWSRFANKELPPRRARLAAGCSVRPPTACSLTWEPA
jgi:hypothetical protein